MADVGTHGARTSVIIPTKNEARNVGWVLERLPGDIDEVILVDASSVDGTVEAARSVRPDIKVVTQTRKGKGNALAAGFEAATGDYIVMIDADGSMDPHEIHAFLGALQEGADYAKGSRFLRGGGSEDITMTRRSGNWCLSFLANTLFLSHYTDLCYGYNAFRRRCLESFGLPTAHGVTDAQWGDGFEIETLMNVRVAITGMKVVEVPSFEYERISGESNLNTVRDGFRVLGTILAEYRSARWSRRRAPASVSPAGLT